MTSSWAKVYHHGNHGCYLEILLLFQETTSFKPNSRVLHDFVLFAKRSDFLTPVPVKYRSCEIGFLDKSWRSQIWYTLCQQCCLCAKIIVQITFWHDHESEGWGSESPSGRDICCLFNFDTFTRTSVNISNVNFIIYICIYICIYIGFARSCGKAFFSLVSDGPLRLSFSSVTWVTYDPVASDKPI